MKCKRKDCQNQIEQTPGGHRRRQYCSDSCRIADFRWRKEQAGLARIKAEQEAKERREWNALTEQYSELLPDQIDLLYYLSKQYSSMEKRVGQALIKTFEFASANENRRKDILVANLMLIGEKLQYPEIEDMPAGPDNWWKHIRSLRLEALCTLYTTTYYRYRLARREAEEAAQKQRELEEQQRRAALYARYQ